MATLEYALLGLLKRKSMTGYDLAKEFSTSLNEFWYAQHSQIYPTLKDLTKKGYVSYQIEISGNVLEKKLYTITKKGIEYFDSWVGTPTKKLPMFKNEFKLKLFFSDLLKDEERNILVSNELELHQKHLKHLISNMQKYQEKPTSGEELADYLVLKGGIMRERMYVDWLLEVIDSYKK